MERMFRKKILVRVDPPTCFAASPFFHVQLRIDPPPSSSRSPLSDPHLSAGASLSVKVESLCWKLSRAWHVVCLCFPDSLDIVVVYKD
ncbi:unnamed protein product [Spirodela intermedia]|uniref:Uncharacterized protein n=1 Tax=Spirodela intermedia TaxID=51605 RepID=A0A7I8J513_SPIIN|nr:unnamed protein product [Spirodela intermedia]CAA6664855.1 unnamed protein product [Spirodela intermedia]